MTTTVYTPISYQGDGSQVDFAITFKYIVKGDLQVWLRDETIPSSPVETLLLEGTHYTLGTPLASLHPTGVVALPSVVTMLIAPSVSEKLIIRRVTPTTQAIDLIPSNPIPANTVELGLDKVTHMAQELSYNLDSFLVPGSGYTPVAVTWPVPEASKLLGWNSTATALENVTPIDVAAIQASITALDGRVTVAEGDIGDLENTQALIISQLGTAQTDINNLDLNDTAQDALIANHESRIQTIESNFAGLGVLEGRVDDLEAEDIGIKARLDAVEADLAVDEPRIVALEQNYLNLTALVLVNRQVGKYSLGNNVSVPVALPNLTWTGAGVQSVEGLLEIYRKTSLETRIVKIKLSLLYNPPTSTWYVERDYTTKIVGEFDGVTFSIVTAPGGVGTIHYTTDEMLGTDYESEMRFIFTELNATLPTFASSYGL